MHARDTVDSEPPASSLPDSWPTETGRITHARCFGRPRRGLLVTQRQIPEAWREGQLRSLLAGLPPSPLLRGQTSRSLVGGVGASTLPLRDGVTRVTGIVHEAWRAFSLHLTSCLCHPSATPSLLGDEPHADPTAGADVTPSQLVQGQKTKQPFLCSCRFTKLV